MRQVLERTLQKNKKTMEIKLKFLEKAIDLRRSYDTPIEIHFALFTAGLLIGILLGAS